MVYAVIGSRDFYSLDLIPFVLSSLPPGSGVVSGGARGVDTVAARFARRLGLPLQEILPNNALYGYKAAPLVRNKEIVQAADRVLAFWDGRSRGTMHACQYALRHGKSVLVWREDGSWASLS